ncbi:ABC transporter permease [Vallitalea sediminicola]
MNKTLFKATLKANWGIGLFFTLFILMYVTISIVMFDPDSAETIDSMLALMPEGMLKAFGFDNLGTDLTGYLAHYLYGFIFLVFPMIYTIIIGNKLIAKHVDNGSMAYILTTPNTRIKIAVTQAIYLIGSIAVIFIINVGIGIAISESMFGGHLDIGKFISLNLVTYLSTIVVSSIVYFFSCLFNESKNAIAFGGGISALFIICRMLMGISEDISWLKYFTIYSFVDIEEILSNSTYVTISSLILLGISGIFYCAAIIIFDRRSLSI